MIQRMRNFVTIKILGNDVDLSGATNIRAYISQNENNFSYVGEVVEGSSNQITFEIPYDDAMKLDEGCVDVQVCFTDVNNIARGTKVIHAPVNRMISPEGYRVI